MDNKDIWKRVLTRIPKKVFKQHITSEELKQIWDELPEECKVGLEQHLPCLKHYNTSTEGGDHWDGPPQSISTCFLCHLDRFKKC